MVDNVDEGFIPFKTIVRFADYIDGVTVGANHVGHEVYFSDRRTFLVPYSDKLVDVGTIPDEVYSRVMTDLRLSISPGVHSSVRPQYRKSAFERLHNSL